MIIDAHHHLWRYNPTQFEWMTDAMDALRRDFLISELNKVMRVSGVDATVAVQARQSLEETEWLLETAEQHPHVAAVVGWVSLIDPRVEECLDRLAPHERLKGVRHVLHDEPDDFYMLREDFNRGVSALERYGLTYDILIFEKHLPQAIAFVDRHPRQRFVVDHIAKPRIKERSISPWREQIAELAKRENVFCKISGMATEANWDGWSVQDFRPYFDAVLSSFGASRLMFGSDWPVLTLAGGYAKWMTAFKSLISELSDLEKEQICAGSAVSAYEMG